MPTQDRSDRPRAGLARREALTGLLFISPWIVGFVLFSALPMIASLFLSLTDFDPRRPDETRFIGLENYAQMLRDPDVLESIWVTCGSRPWWFR